MVRRCCWRIRIVLAGIMRPLPRGRLSWPRGAKVGRVAGPYQLQAHLAACHSTAARWEATDWDRIVALYDLMLRMSANPAVALNRAIAIGERDGPAAQLAARADALRRLGQISQAREELRAAAELAISAPERRL